MIQLGLFDTYNYLLCIFNGDADAATYALHRWNTGDHNCISNTFIAMGVRR
jgi:hypothetical protein